jgi:hypothetical protein
LAPGLDIFSSGYVLRDAAGWQITDDGRSFLTSIEAPAPLVEAEPPPEAVVSPSPVPPSNVIEFVDHQHKRRPRAAA